MNKLIIMLSRTRELARVCTFLCGLIYNNAQINDAYNECIYILYICGRANVFFFIMFIRLIDAR